MIKVILGNLFDSNAQILAHQVNCKGVMGSGVAKEVRERYPHVFNEYRKCFETGQLKLGYVCLVEAKPGQLIANLCGQNGFGYSGHLYTDYNAIETCLKKVHVFMKEHELTTIAFPWMMSCCRGGGNWDTIYSMIETIFEDVEVEIWKLQN